MSQETGKEKKRSKNQAFFERMRREHGDWAEQWVDPGQQRVFIPQQMPYPLQFQNQFQPYPTQFQLSYLDRHTSSILFRRSSSSSVKLNSIHFRCHTIRCIPPKTRVPTSQAERRDQHRFETSVSAWKTRVVVRDG